MKYLDEQIIATSTITSPLPKGIYQYRVYRKNDTDSTYDLIFVGNLYKSTATLSRFSVDITDIVKNDTWVPTYEEFYNSTSNINKTVKIVNSYKVEFTDDGTLLHSNAIQVAKVYRYPHYMKDMQGNIFFDYTSATGSTSCMLQGRWQSGSLYNYICPAHYPLAFTDNYRFIIPAELGTGVGSMQITMNGGITATRSLSASNKYPSFVYSETLKSLLFNARMATHYQSAWGSVEQKSTPVYNLSKEGNTLTISGSTMPYYKIVLTYGARYDKDYTGWLKGGEDNVVELTVDEAFYNAAQDNNGAIWILFSNTKGTGVGMNSYDRVYFNLEALPESTIGKNIIFKAIVSRNQENTAYEMTAPEIGVRPCGTDTTITFDNDRFGIIDSCPARFYLQWQDRMGGFQSQPFNKYYTYSEEINRETITDYRGKKKVSNVQVVPSFKISTDWINETLYPYYESIYTSPVLFLYDTQEDKTYSVILKDTDYTEKRFDNQKTLFNLTLNLEVNNTQTIIY